MIAVWKLMETAHLSSWNPREEKEPLIRSRLRVEGRQWVCIIWEYEGRADQPLGPTGTTLSPRAAETNQENRETPETTYLHVTDCLFYPVTG